MVFYMYCVFIFFILFSVPPHKMVIVDKAGKERTSVVGPYTEGADLILRCDVYGGKEIKI